MFISSSAVGITNPAAILTFLFAFSYFDISQNAGEQMPAVIFSHGFGGNYQVGTQYAEALAEKGYVVYCFDFCGGSPESRSDGSTLEMSIFTEQADLEAVIAMFQNLDYGLRRQHKRKFTQLFLFGNHSNQKRRFKKIRQRH